MTSFSQPFFKSPEALAQQFEEAARVDDNQAKYPETTKRDVLVLQREAVTWRTATEPAPAACRGCASNAHDQHQYAREHHVGQFDNVRFNHPMPDGFDGGNFQCKDLRSGMDMATYEVGADGRLRRIASDEGQPLEDVNYSHHLVITGDDHPHAYTLVFDAGTLREIRCLRSGATVPFVAVDGGSCRELVIR